jgi:hypothetical protein
LIEDEEGFGFFAEVAQESSQFFGEIRPDERIVARLPAFFFGKFQESRIELVEEPRAGGKIIRERGFEGENLVLEEFGREHFAGTIDKIVRFVDEEREIGTFAGEVALERDEGIERIIVIADDAVGPKGKVERKFERTDLVLAGESFDFRAREDFEMERVFERGFDAIIVTDGERAGADVAGLAVVEADFVARSDGDSAGGV